MLSYTNMIISKALSYNVPLVLDGVKTVLVAFFLGCGLTTCYKSAAISVFANKHQRIVCFKEKKYKYEVFYFSLQRMHNKNMCRVPPNKKAKHKKKTHTHTHIHTYKTQKGCIIFIKHGRISWIVI